VPDAPPENAPPDDAPPLGVREAEPAASPVGGTRWRHHVAPINRRATAAHRQQQQSTEGEPRATVRRHGVKPSLRVVRVLTALVIVASPMQYFRIALSNTHAKNQT